MLLVAVGFSLAGCGGGSEGGLENGGGASETPPPVTKPDGRGTVVVTATDVLGDPLVGATINLSTHWPDESRQAFTDSSGVAEIKDVIASTFSVTVQGPDSFGYAPDRNLAAGESVAITVAAIPAAEATGGVVSASVPVGGASSDGRTLEFSLQILQVPTTSEYWAFDTDAVRVLACAPDPGNDVSRFRPDCIAGADGFDASYEGLTVSIRRVGGTARATPGAAVLLIDQGTNVVVNDPGDTRLFAAKYFLASGGTGDRTALAAFSSDLPASSQFSLLPQKPVTFFPVENPQFTADGRSYFATIDQLGAMEGGASPLHESIDSALNFAATDSQNDAKALVVVTNGYDDTCGTRSECRSRLDALVQKSKATGVAIVTVGLGDAAGKADHEALGLLSQGAAGGAAIWVPKSRQLPMVLGDVRSFLAGTRDTLEVTFRLQSPDAGAFASGRTVIGQVSLEVCPWDCNYTAVPFAVQVP